MPVRYSKQIEKTGAAVGSVISVVRPSTYTTSNIESVESANWNIDNTYPGWIECDGRILNVSDYEALYSIIGNTYGGSFGVTFKVPDYRSKRICGTGALNGNSGSSLFLPSVFGPNGNPGGSRDLAGSSGGFYILDTFRQLPAGSEVTPGSPSNPAVLGGTSVDTFSLGTFVSQGFTGVSETVDCELTGDITFGMGPVRETTVSAVPPHFHFVDTSQIGSQRASVAAGNDPDITGDDGNPYYFFRDNRGSVRNFNRSLRRWDGAVTDPGIGGLDVNGEVGDLTLNFGNGVLYRNYGTGSSATDGFSRPGQVSETAAQYVSFNGGSSRGVTRTLTWNIGDGTLAQIFGIVAIAGTDGNGGERVNGRGWDGTSYFDPAELPTLVPLAQADGGVPANNVVQDESLFVSFSSSAGSAGPFRVLPDFTNSPQFNTENDFSAYDAAYASWKEFTTAIPASVRGTNFTVTLTQFAQSEEDSFSSGVWDNFGIASMRVSGQGGSYTYTSGDTPIPLQRHSHMIFWEEPNTGDIVPGSLSTFGAGGGADLSYVDEGETPINLGLRSGGTAETIVSTNDSVNTQITKTIDINNELGSSIRPATVTLTDSSRIAFDNAISIRLEAAEELVLLSPYFRTKYLIKAY